MKPTESTLAKCQRLLRADVEDLFARSCLVDWLHAAGDICEAVVQQRIMVTFPVAQVTDVHLPAAIRLAYEQSQSQGPWNIEVGWDPALLIWVYRHVSGTDALPWLALVSVEEPPTLESLHNDAWLNGVFDIRDIRLITPTPRHNANADCD